MKEGEHAEAAAITMIAAGIVKAGERLPEGERQCPHCGACVEDARHRYYTCPSLGELEDPGTILAKTKWLGEKVQ